MYFLGRNSAGLLLSTLVIISCGGSAGTSNDTPLAGNALAGSNEIESPVVNGFFLKTIEVATPHGGVFIRQENTLNEDTNTITHDYATRSGDEFKTKTLSTSTYNAAGNPTSTVIEYPRHYPPGDKTTFTYTYNDDGLLVHRHTVTVFDEKENSYRVNYTYNDANAMIKRENLNFNNGAVLSTEDFEVNSDGKTITLTKEDLLTIDGVPVESTNSYNYDSEGRLVSTINSSNRYKIEYFYDDNGNIITKVDGYTNGTVDFTSTYTYVSATEKVFNEILQSLYFDPYF